MKLKRLLVALSATVALQAGAETNITPFNLANAGYQGVYEDLTLESGRRLGKAGLFCQNVRYSKAQVANALIGGASAENRLAVDDSNYRRALRNQLRYLCKR